MCGAAILIAARYHGFKRNMSQIVRVVHVCQETIRKRLDEFKDTNTAKLTREEFMALEGGGAEPEESMDPPSFVQTQSKRLLQIEDGLDDLHKMLEEKANRIEEKLVKIDSGSGQEEGKDD